MKNLSGKSITDIPKIANDITKFTHNEFEIYSWDVGGSDKIRALWKPYYQDAKVFIFVVDSSNKDRMSVAAEEFERAI